jgi:hypothetical protein
MMATEVTAENFADATTPAETEEVLPGDLLYFLPRFSNFRRPLPQKLKMSPTKSH